MWVMGEGCCEQLNVRGCDAGRGAAARVVGGGCLGGRWGWGAARHCSDWFGGRPVVQLHKCSIPFKAGRCVASCVLRGSGAMLWVLCREVFNELPLEFAAEVNQLMSLKLEGSVG